MRVKMAPAGILMVRCRTNIFRQERDLLRLTTGMQDTFKIFDRMRDETKGKVKGGFNHAGSG